MTTNLIKFLVRWFIILILAGLTAFIIFLGIIIWSTDAHSGTLLKAAENPEIGDWVREHTNGFVSCCLPSDSIFIETWRVSSLVEGNEIKVRFPSGEMTVTVKKIYPTQDSQGRSVITKYGCLFRPFGM